MPKNEITCIVCPLGCRIELDVGPDSHIERINGHQCKKGKEYAVMEFENPSRVLTTTLTAEGSKIRLLPVRTDMPVSRHLLRDIVKSIKEIKVTPPIRPGHIIIRDVLGTGANLISTGNLK
ncbi:MAG: DUF1667 domain-containing protein [Deltaproteobacteria bacterium]|nr:DUF1667 domain-containing protein [Deltaproteobacteria bacterium]